MKTTITITTTDDSPRCASEPKPRSDHDSLNRSPVFIVEIGGQQFPVRSARGERYVTDLASYVDQKMRAASNVAPTSDMLDLAVLVALNITDEFFRATRVQEQGR
jgi:hypothetical protein